MKVLLLIAATASGLGPEAAAALVAFASALLASAMGPLPASEEDDMTEILLAASRVA